MTDLQDRIAQLEAELAAQRREMQEFTSAVSHELRAPLRHIVSYAALVKEDAGLQLGVQVLGFLDTISGSASRLGLMLDGLLALSRVGAVVLAVQPVSLQKLVEDITTDLSNRNPHQAISWKLADDLPMVMADPALLRLALESVLDNAVKFSRLQDVARVGVVAVMDATNRQITLRVQDNGVGFSPAGQSGLMKPSFMQPFVRLHSRTQFDGLGVGLALASKAMRRMGGQLTMDAVVAATVVEGCCVTFTGLRY